MDESLRLESSLPVESTDGDSQETSQLDVAMSTLMPEAIRARCIWHVVDRRMRKKHPNYVSTELKRQKEKKTFKAIP
jgi:transposase-like protein